MMRFILKCAFWLGLVAFLLPFGEHRGETATDISWLGAVAGAQEALQDVGGFCGRAPRACETGREIALFASERISDGVSIAYGLIERRNAPSIPDVAGMGGHRATEANAATDPLMTGGVFPAEAQTALPPPRAYTAPKRAAPAAVPTPAPRL